MLGFYVLFSILSCVLNRILNSYNAQNNLFYYLKLYLIYFENAQGLVVNFYVNCGTLLDILNQLRKWLLHCSYSFLIERNPLMVGNSLRCCFLLNCRVYTLYPILLFALAYLFINRDKPSLIPFLIKVYLSSTENNEISESRITLVY